MDRAHFYHAYLGTNSMRGSRGIYHISIRKEDLDFQVISACQALNADYICLSPDQRTLYATYELTYFNGRPTSGAGAYRLEEDGGITLLNQRNVHGQMACYCSTDRAGTTLFSSSYMSGSITATELLADGSLGESQRIIPQPVRAGYHWPSVHSVYETPDERYIFSTNVGLDRVLLHRKDGTPVCELPVEGRPRQAAFSADGRFIYVSTEAGGEVFVLAYDGTSGTPLRLIQRISTTLPGWTGHAETAGIKRSPDGRMLLVANRAMDLNCLAVFSIHPSTGQLTFVHHAKVHGVFPRDLDFTPDGRYVLVGLQFSDNLELFGVEEDHLVSRRADFALPCCSGVKFLR